MKDINNIDDSHSFGSNKPRTQSHDSAHPGGKDQFSDWSTAGRGVHNPLGVNSKGHGFGTDSVGSKPMGTPAGAYRGSRAKKRISY